MVGRLSSLMNWFFISFNQSGLSYRIVWLRASVRGYYSSLIDFLNAPSCSRKIALAPIDASIYRFQLANVTRARAFRYSDISEPPADENSFRFTPIKALRALPRLWERKPATPFKAGLKRKLWKRFQSSFSNMQSLESSTAIDHDALQTAINTSKDSSYVRGVKRLCVGPGESADKTNVELSPPMRPFLETKWESEVSRKRREY
jgi:hypothetical protein